MRCAVGGPVTVKAHLLKPRSLVLIGAVALAIAAITSAAAQTSRPSAGRSVAKIASSETLIPRWWVMPSGSFVNYKESAGLSEVAQETLQGQAELQVRSNTHVHGLPPVSDCIAKAQQTIEDPASTSLPGTGVMSEFEVICEKGTGNANAAEPYPCTATGEPFEIKATGAWPGTLEAPGSKNPIGYQYFERFSPVEVSVYCLQTKNHAVYSGSLLAEVRLGRLRFTESGTLAASEAPEHTIEFKGNMVVNVPRYKDVRAHVR